MSEVCERCGKDFPHDANHQHAFGSVVCGDCWSSFRIRPFSYTCEDFKTFCNEEAE